VRVFRSHAVALSAALLVACAADPVRVETVLHPVLTTPDSLTVLEGDSARLTATVADSDGSLLPHVAVVWAVADTTVVRVSPNGMLQWLRPRTTTAVALAGGETRAVTVNAAVRFVSWGAGSGGYTSEGCGATTRGLVFCDGYDSLRPLPLPAGLAIASLTSALNRTFHRCALATDGRGFCWGNNYWGAAGIADTSVNTSVPPTEIAGGRKYLRLTIGTDHSCALEIGGAAWCWGLNGALGDSVGQRHRLPVRVSGGHLFTEISTGSGHTCAVATDASLWCWGANGAGQLGTGNTTGSGYPVVVPGGLAWRSVGSGAAHTCAIAMDGTGWCWGQNSSGELGATSSGMCGTAPCSTVPLALPLGPLRAIAAGLQLTCAADAQGTASCWGVNAISPPPTLKFVSLSMGDTEVCGTTEEQLVYCWGGHFGSAAVRVRNQP